MSQENVASNRLAVEAANRGDLDGWLAYFDPEIVWYGLADERTLAPFEAIKAFWRWPRGGEISFPIFGLRSRNTSTPVST